MFDGDEDRAETRRSLVLLFFLLAVPSLGAIGVFSLIALSIWFG